MFAHFGVALEHVCVFLFAPFNSFTRNIVRNKLLCAYTKLTMYAITLWAFYANLLRIKYSPVYKFIYVLHMLQNDRIVCNQIFILWLRLVSFEHTHTLRGVRYDNDNSVVDERKTTTSSSSSSNFMKINHLFTHKTLNCCIKFSPKNAFHAANLAQTLLRHMYTYIRVRSRMNHDKIQCLRKITPKPSRKCFWECNNTQANNTPSLRDFSIKIFMLITMHTNSAWNSELQLRDYLDSTEPWCGNGGKKKIKHRY